MRVMEISTGQVWDAGGMRSIGAAWKVPPRGTSNLKERKKERRKSDLLSVGSSVRLCGWLAVRPSVRLSVSRSLCPSVWRSVRSSIHPSVGLEMRPTAQDQRSRHSRPAALKRHLYGASFYLSSLLVSSLRLLLLLLLFLSDRSRLRSLRCCNCNIPFPDSFAFMCVSSAHLPK